MERDPLCALGPDTRKLAEFVDQILDGPSNNAYSGMGWPEAAASGPRTFLTVSRMESAALRRATG